MFHPLLDEFLQKWNRGRKVYAKSSETKDVFVKLKVKKNGRTTKAKENESDNSTETDVSDDGNQVSDNEVANVRRKRKLTTFVKQQHKSRITVEKLIGFDSTLLPPYKIRNKRTPSTVVCDGCEILSPTHNHCNYPPQRFCVNDAPTVGTSFGKGWV